MPDCGISTVAVVGAGIMGHGIAEVTALAGYQVILQDIDEEMVAEGYSNIVSSLPKLRDNGQIDDTPEEVLARIETTTTVEKAAMDADLVIEAAPEDLDLKHEVFAELDRVSPGDAILASNTSSLPVSDIATATTRPAQVLGLHFFNPPVNMDLVEVIYGSDTSDATAQRCYEFVESIEKTPIYVRKDIRGFVVSTALSPFLSEPMWMVSMGEATIQDADVTMVFKRGYPMGPFELADMTGIDVGYHVRQEAGKPSEPIREEKMENEEFGKKTGKGFYDYEDGPGVDYGRIRLAPSRSTDRERSCQARS
jgi:enoyl-CoA hydratase/3-hydroxyacyl-CoA dehydrogenase